MSKRLYEVITENKMGKEKTSKASCYAYAMLSMKYVLYVYENEWEDQEADSLYMVSDVYWGKDVKIEAGEPYCKNNDLEK